MAAALLPTAHAGIKAVRQNAAAAKRSGDLHPRLLRPSVCRSVLLLGRARYPADGLLIDVRVGARVLDQVVAEGSDIVADEFQNSLAGRHSLLEEIDKP